MKKLTWLIAAFTASCMLSGCVIPPPGHYHGHHGHGAHQGHGPQGGPHGGGPRGGRGHR